MLALSMLAYGQTIRDVACGTNGLSTLCTAINNSPTVLAALSAAGTYTVFAPNNDAFDALPDGALADLLKPENEPALTNLLLKHTLGSKVPAADALNLDNEPVDTLASTNSITEKIVVDGNGNILLDEEGQVPLGSINAAISKATGIAAPQGVSTSLSFNEVNTEVQTR